LFIDIAQNELPFHDMVYTEDLKQRSTRQGAFVEDTVAASHVRQIAETTVPAVLR
jgi:hypothetical protein